MRKPISRIFFSQKIFFSRDHTARLWNIIERRCLKIINHTVDVRSVFFNNFAIFTGEENSGADSSGQNFVKKVHNYLIDMKFPVGIFQRETPFGKRADYVSCQWRLFCPPAYWKNLQGHKKFYIWTNSLPFFQTAFHTAKCQQEI